MLVRMLFLISYPIYLLLISDDICFYYHIQYALILLARMVVFIIMFVMLAAYKSVYLCTLSYPIYFKLISEGICFYYHIRYACYL